MTKMIDCKAEIFVLRLGLTLYHKTIKDVKGLICMPELESRVDFKKQLEANYQALSRVERECKQKIQVLEDEISLLEKS